MNPISTILQIAISGGRSAPDLPDMSSHRIYHTLICHIWVLRYWIPMWELNCKLADLPPWSARYGIPISRSNCQFHLICQIWVLTVGIYQYLICHIWVLRVWIYKYQSQIAISWGVDLPPDLQDMSSYSRNLSVPDLPHMSSQSMNL